MTESRSFSNYRHVKAVLNEIATHPVACVLAEVFTRHIDSERASVIDHSHAFGVRGLSSHQDSPHVLRLQQRPGGEHVLIISRSEQAARLSHNDLRLETVNGMIQVHHGSENGVVPESDYGMLLHDATEAAEVFNFSASTESKLKLS